MNDKILHPTVQWLYNTATKIRNDLSRFYRDTDKDRIRFNFGETPFAYTFKIKFTPSHRVLKFIVSKEFSLDTIECQLFEKTNNIIRDIDQIYEMKSQEYIQFTTTDETPMLEILKLWLWGCFVRSDRKNDIYKVQARWIDHNTRSEDLLYVAIIAKVNVISKNQKASNTNKLFSDVVEPIVKIHLELMTPEGTYIKPIDVLEGMEGTIHPGQIYITNWMDRYAIMRFTPAKHHLSFTPTQYAFITDYLSEEIKDGYNNRKESQDRRTTAKSIAESDR